MEDVLTPLDQMLVRRTFLLGERPVYADFALYGVIGNYLYSGENELPRALEHVHRWHAGVTTVRLTPHAPPQ
ncbi:MAG: glutathione S-transferase C-terminal domain-containing protein [Chloroflexota bacterium]|nr:glutathione S-transferase C-terminal domain-containing protein [Chloroflexota bacterium]